MDEVILAACRAHTPQFDRMDTEIRNYAYQQMKDAIAIATEKQAAENARLREAIAKAMEDMWPCNNDGGFDRETGPIGCMLGDKCVCIGIYPTLASAVNADVQVSTNLPTTGDAND